MKTRTVKLIHPQRSSWVRMSVSTLPFKGTDSIYDTVDFFRDNIYSKSKIKFFGEKIENRILLRDIVNVHNVGGIRLISQIKSMLKQIKSGGHVLNSDGLPNIKLVKTKNKEWVLFDGHHTMLAYMLAGSKYLDEVPHLIVEDGKRVYVSDKEIHVFFGEHLTRLRDKDWRDYVIDWQAKEENQLQERIQKDMGELLDSLNI